MMVPGRPASVDGDINRATPEEYAAAAAGYFAYAGRWELDAEAEIVVHAIETSLVPNRIDQRQQRCARLAGDLLELSVGPILILGETRTAHLAWRRLPGV